MHVISFKKIREFFSTHRDVASSLTAVYKTVKKANWQKLAELKEVIRPLILGPIHRLQYSGNKYRLIARIVFEPDRSLVVAVMTHEEI